MQKRKGRFEAEECLGAPLSINQGLFWRVVWQSFWVVMGVPMIQARNRFCSPECRVRIWAYPLMLRAYSSFCTHGGTWGTIWSVGDWTLVSHMRSMPYLLDYLSGPKGNFNVILEISLSYKYALISYASCLSWVSIKGGSLSPLTPPTYYKTMD